MDKHRTGEVRNKLMNELANEWPVSAGQVQAAAEMVDEPDVASAALLLPDDDRWGSIDSLWEDLEPLIDDVILR